MNTTEQKGTGEEKSLSVEEGNKLIAKFMGAKIEKPYSDYDGVSGLMFYFKDNTSPILYRSMALSEVKYHSSWDWLMPVVEKIEGLKEGDFSGVYKLRIDPWDISITDYRQYEHDDDEGAEDIVCLHRDSESRLIDDIHFAVVSFIQWYISQQSNK